MKVEEADKKGPILAAVDFSDGSEAALAWAADLASSTATELVVVHVVHDPAHAPGYYARKPDRKQQLVPLETAAEKVVRLSPSPVTIVKA